MSSGAWANPCNSANERVFRLRGLWLQLLRPDRLLRVAHGYKIYRGMRVRRDSLRGQRRPDRDVQLSLPRLSADDRRPVHSRLLYAGESFQDYERFAKILRNEERDDWRQRSRV